MNPALKALLAELERFGLDNDAVISERPRRMLNITRDTGEFLAVLVRAMGARRVLEIGTSNGYSTLWLADAAAAVGGRVSTVELSPFKIALAAENFRRAELAGHIDQFQEDAGVLLRRQRVKLQQHRHGHRQCWLGRHLGHGLSGLWRTASRAGGHEFAVADWNQAGDELGVGIDQADQRGHLLGMRGGVIHHQQAAGAQHPAQLGRRRCSSQSPARPVYPRQVRLSLDAELQQRQPE